jgi:transcriptional repressor NrdR
MRCPKCSSNDDKVIETRISKEGETIRRRRQCQNCLFRFTTYETVIPTDMFVVKRDGRREDFNPEKLRLGIKMACWKRPVESEQIDKVVGDITTRLTLLPTQEIPSHVIGEMAMEELKKVDEIAFVRFASVYRHFNDAGEFISEVQKLTSQND